MDTELTSPFSMVTDLQGETFGEGIGYSEVTLQQTTEKPTLIGRHIRVIGPYGSQTLEKTGTVIDAGVLWHLPDQPTSYLIKFDDHTIRNPMWELDEDIEVMK